MTQERGNILKKGISKTGKQKPGIKKPKEVTSTATRRRGGKKTSGQFLSAVELKEFLSVLAATDVVEFEYGKKDLHIVIKKDTVGEIIGDEILPPREGSEPPSNHWQKYRIKSPAVGIFHLVENAVPLCSVGDIVKKGRKLGWVNSMGIPQDIMVEKDGRIVSIFCSDSGVVEWGQDLFEIEDV